MSASSRTRPARRRGWPVPSLDACIAIVAAGVLAGWLFYALAAQYLRTYDLGQEATRLERRKQELLIQNAALYAEIHRLRTDDRYIERLAREQLGMVRPGEIEFVIVPAPSDRHAASPQAAEPSGPRQSGQATSPRIRRIQAVITSLRGWLRTTVNAVDKVAPWLRR